tara:strand:+ start:825 stop:1004 length:180 start_codon:yes stop_codon:yes gene_type:complete
MTFSDRTKRLLNWWQLRIEKSREEIKEKNVTGNDTTTHSTISDGMGNEDKERQRIKEDG